MSVTVPAAPTDRAAPLARLRGVSFAYGATPVLEDVSLDIEPRTLVGVIGPNGSGKSTLLKVIAGLLEPSSGTIELFGTPIARFREWWRVGYVPQRPRLLGVTVPASVEEVVSAGRLARLGPVRRPRAADRAAVLDAIETVGLSDRRRRPIAELSGGQQQRVLIARALASEPQLLLLDEALAGVDLDTQEDLYALFHRLTRERDLAVVFVSHDVGVLATQVTTMACLNRRLLYWGSPEALREGDLFEQLYGGASLFAHTHLHAHGDPGPRPRA
ncbi:MAG TPA: metal ABC transporter ATP-binding protein [Thermodesulfobacteriota bacterium]